jgi:hypothetical protein
MILVKHGVPWDVAWGMSPARRLATLVVSGELDGGEFDWDRLRWKERKK